MTHMRSRSHFERNTLFTHRSDKYFEQKLCFILRLLLNDADTTETI
jgi:hypothetical protein